MFDRDASQDNSGTGCVVVTGAASGIGAATALLLARRGHDLALVDRDSAGLQDVAERARAAGVRVDCHTVDVSDAEALSAALAASNAEIGPFAGIVSAAGILRPGALAEVSDEDWRAHFRVNTDGVMHLLRAGIPLMRDGGAVAVVSSNAAGVPRTGMVAYAASKAATSALTRCVGLEVADRGIRCNVVEPGSTRTPMQRDLWPDPVAGEEAALRGAPAEHRVGIPLGRLAETDDVAGLLTFLLSPAARHITLQQIRVDGGASL